MFIQGYGCSLFNVSHIVSLFYGNQTGNVRAEMMNGRNAVISEIMTTEEGQVCLKLIADEMAKGKEVITCPNPERIRAVFVNQTETRHHVTGKKTKGHGSS